MGDGFEKYLSIEPERPAVDVGEVKLHPAIEVELAAAFERPQASHTGAHAQTTPLPRLVLLDLFGQWRSWSDKRHVSAQNVPQLRQFIETGTAQPSAHGSAARIVSDLENRPIYFIQMLKLGTQFFGVVHHRTEFIEGEAPPAESATHLAIKHWAA